MNYRIEIQKKLNERNISRARFCREAGISSAYFNNIINGVKNLTPRLAAQLEIFGIGKAQDWGKMIIEEHLQIEKTKYDARV
jgi:plasmid maintenance system antidote protein VapI